MDNHNPIIEENDPDNSRYDKRLQKSFNDAQKELVYRRSTIDRLRGNLQNCVNHLEMAKRHCCRDKFDECIESANKALYETLKNG